MRARRLTALAACVSAFAPAPGALAAPQAGMQASLKPDRAGARAAATVALHISDPAAVGDVPAPLRTVTIHLPPGLRVDVAGVAVCQAAALRRHGRAGCPAASRVGSGHATLEVHAGSQTIPEASQLTAFRGPAAGGRPTLLVLGVGSTPLEQRSVSRGVLGADSSPLGSRLTLSVPPIPTLELEPDASFLSLALTIGPSRSAPTHAALVTPAHCPAGGFPFAADLVFRDGSTARAAAAVPCP